ncbi:MAG TPA: hypothetical protein VEI97_05365 [bacterium]|nr:hypothetical protein [bacterium]
MTHRRTDYSTLEAAALAAHGRRPPDTGADPFAFDDVPGTHCRLVSAFAWHPLLRRNLQLPPLAMLVLVWISAAILWSRAPVPQPWGDEAFTLEVIALPWDGMLERLAGDLHPPLYFALMKLAYGLGAQDLHTIRLIGFLLAGLPLGLLPLLLHAWPRTYRLLGAMVALVLTLYPLGFYLIMARYYGLLAMLVAYGVVLTGNGLERRRSDSSLFWWIGGAVCLGLAALTNYQVWLVWTVVALVAARLLHRQQVPTASLGRFLTAHIAVALLTAIATVAVTDTPLDQLRDAGASPFETGFVSLAAEVVARAGVLAMAFLSGELIPLWWPPLLLLAAFGLFLYFPRVYQSSLSPTALLAGQTALICAAAMAVLTATALPVGLEFLPPRVLYCFPLAALSVAEWLLRRTAVLRWWGALTVLNLLMALGGLSAAHVAIQTRAPAPTAPFLHATYLTPAQGILRVLEETPYKPGADLLVIEDPGTLYALREAGLPEAAGPTLMFEESGDPFEWLIDRQGELYLIAATRDLTPGGQRDRWEEFLGARAVLVEEWQFLHEDPLWLAAKRLGLHREVEPYKKTLRRFRLRPRGSP